MLHTVKSSLYIEIFRKRGLALSVCLSVCPVSPKRLPRIYHNIIYDRTDMPAKHRRAQQLLLLFLFFGTRHVALIKPKMSLSAPLKPPLVTHLSSFLLSACVRLFSCFCCWAGTTSLWLPRSCNCCGSCCCCFCGCWYLSCLLILYICVASLAITGEDLLPLPLLLPLLLFACAAAAKQTKQHKLQNKNSFYGLCFYLLVFLDFMCEIL